MAERQPYRWEDLEDEFRASAEAYREISNEIGLAFRHAQGEAYESWRSINKWADAREEEAQE